MRTVAECADYCASERACAAWTLDKPRLLCMLRLLGGSTVHYTADAISARLSAAELTERAAERDLELAPERASPAELAGNASADAAPSASTIAPARPAYSGPPWPLPADLAARGVTDNVDLLGGDLHRVGRQESPSPAAARNRRTGPLCTGPLPTQRACAGRGACNPAGRPCKLPCRFPCRFPCRQPAASPPTQAPRRWRRDAGRLPSRMRGGPRRGLRRLHADQGDGLLLAQEHQPHRRRAEPDQGPRLGTDERRAISTEGW